MADRLSVAIAAEINEFERRMAMLPDVGGKQAKELARSIRREMKNAEDGVGQSSQKMGRSLGEVSTVLEKGLKKLGPLGNEVADVLFDFAAPLGEAASGVLEVGSGLGGVGVAATAAGAAVAGVAAAVAAVAVGTGVAVAGLKAVVDSAVEARDRLIEAGRAAEIPAESQLALDQYVSASSELRVQWDLFLVSMGGEGAQTLAGLTVMLTELVKETNEWSDSLGGAVNLVFALGEGFEALGSWSPVIGALAGSIDTLEMTLKRANELGAEVWTDYGPPAWMAPRIEAATKATAELAKEVETTFAPAVEDAFTIHDEFVAEVIKAYRRDLPIAFQGMIVKYQDGAAALEATANAARKLTEAELGMIRDLAIGTAMNVAQGVESITDVIIDNYEARAAAGEQLGRAEMRTANTLAIAAKAAAISQLTLNGLIAWFQLTRDLGLIPGNAIGAPFEAAGIIAASMIAPAAQILGQDVPFPTGNHREGGGTVGALIGPQVDNPGYGDPVEERGTQAGYASAYGAGNLSRSRQGGGDSVTFSVTFTNGRFGKRTIR